MWLAFAFAAYCEPGAPVDDRPWGAATISGWLRCESSIRRGPLLHAPPDWATVGCEAGWSLIIEPMEEHPVVVRELTAADLGDEVLLELIRADDPLGVLSIYLRC